MYIVHSLPHAGPCHVHHNVQGCKLIYKRLSHDVSLPRAWAPCHLCGDLLLLLDAWPLAATSGSSELASGWLFLVALLELRSCARVWLGDRKYM